MSIEFENPLTAGTVLVREQIQSQNYDPGNDGWVIKANGDAEFNNLTIRGTFYGSEFVMDENGMFFYDGTPASGNLIMSIAAEQGTDPYGNDYRRGVMVYNASGSSLQMDAGAGSVGLTFVPPDVTGVTWADGNVTVGTASRLGPDTPFLSLSSPYNSASASSAEVTLYGRPETSTDPDGVTNEVFASTQRVTVTGKADIGGELTAANIQSGSFSITPTTAGQWTSNAAVSFPSTFDTAPVVMVTPSGGGPGTGTTTDLQWQVTGTTTSGFNCRILRGNTTATTLSYLAISTP